MADISAQLALLDIGGNFDLFNGRIGGVSRGVGGFFCRFSLSVDRPVDFLHFVQLAAGENIQPERENRGGAERAQRPSFAGALAAIFAVMFFVLLVKSLRNSIDAGRNFDLYFAGALIGLIGAACCLVYSLLNFILPVFWQHDATFKYLLT
jgi:hypothetical protein